MVVVADGDVGARAYVVIGFEVEVAHRAGVVVALKIAANLVVAISDPGRKQRLFEFSSRRADSVAQPETTTMSESCSCKCPSASK